MDESSFFAHFSRISPHSSKLFKMLKEREANDPLFPYATYLENVLSILRNTEKTFVERRGIDFFQVFLDKLSSDPFFPKGTPICQVSFWSHMVTFPFQSKSVVGFFIELSGLHSQAEDIKNTLCKCHPEILLIENATILTLTPQKNRTTLYFEVQKKEKSFSPDEIEDLKEGLEEIGSTLIERCKALIPSLESSFKTLRWLMNELEVGDLPHVLIDFDMQIPERLRFLAVICQAGDQCQPFTKFLECSDIEVECQLNEGVKEGIVLKIDLHNSPSLSLVEKREQISQLIETHIGPFRDVNGGLLEKIESNFKALSSMTPPSKNLRLFFDAITPEHKRATTPPAMLKEIYAASQKLSDTEYTLLENKSWMAVILKLATDFKKETKEALIKKLPDLGISYITIPTGTILICFLQSPTPEETKTLKTETKASFEKWGQKQECKQVLRLCTTSPFTSFDPRTGLEEETSYLHKMLFEGLMRISPSGTPEPAIAKRVEVSKDGKCYTFFLRKTFWSNGMPVTTHDFLYSWKMILTHENLAPLSYLFDGIENAEAIKEGKKSVDSLGAVALDDYTLKINMQSPCTPLLEICALTLFSPICQAIDEQWPSWSEAQGDDYICNGPFCLEKKEENGGVVLRKNPFYWETDKVHLQKVTIPLVSQEKGKNLFRKKEMDALLYYFYKNPASVPLKNNEAQSLKGGIFMCYLCFNCSQPPFHNKKVRQALALAIDREKIAETCPEKVFPCSSFFDPHYAFSQTNPYPQDIKKAQKLLIEALTEDKSVRETLFNQHFFVLESSVDLGHLLCHHIKDVLGLNWDVSTIGLSTKENLKKKFGMRLYAWIDKIHDPSYLLGSLFCTDQPTNRSRWTSPRLQTLIEKSKIAQTYEQQTVFFQEASILLSTEAPMIPLFYEGAFSLYHSHLKDLYGNHLQQFDIRFLSKQ